MPIYAFKCKSCGATRDWPIPIHELDETTLICECGCPMTRQFSPPAIVFVGGGWGCKP